MKVLFDAIAPNYTCVPRNFKGSTGQTKNPKNPKFSIYMLQLKAKQLSFFVQLLIALVMVGRPLREI